MSPPIFDRLQTNFNVNLVPALFAIDSGLDGCPDKFELYVNLQSIKLVNKICANFMDA